MAADPASRRESASRRWARRLGILAATLLLVVGAGYVLRRTLLLDIARVVLDRDSELLAQEKADGVRIVFAKPPPPFVAPLKNVMNPMWQVIGAEGVNYYTFAGPANLFRSYSERSNPASPYYQAWVGGYVTKRRDGTMPRGLAGVGQAGDGARSTLLARCDGRPRSRSPNRRPLRAWEASSSTVAPSSCGTAPCAVTATSAKAQTDRWPCWSECRRNRPGRAGSARFTK